MAAVAGRPLGLGFRPRMARGGGHWTPVPHRPPPMAAKARRKKVRHRSPAGPGPATGSAAAGGAESDSGLRLRLQILAAVFLPGALVLAWLNSRGFFQGP